jgi:hypothetical protein
VKRIGRTSDADAAIEAHILALDRIVKFFLRNAGDADRGLALALGKAGITSRSGTRYQRDGTDPLIGASVTATCRLDLFQQLAAPADCPRLYSALLAHSWHSSIWVQFASAVLAPS